MDALNYGQLEAQTKTIVDGCFKDCYGEDVFDRKKKG